MWREQWVHPTLIGRRDARIEGGGAGVRECCSLSVCGAGWCLVRYGGHSVAAEQVPSCGRTMKHYEVSSAGPWAMVTADHSVLQGLGTFFYGLTLRHGAGAV